MSLERVEPTWTHLSPCKLQNSLEMGNFGTDSAARGGSGGNAGGGGVIGEGCRTSAREGVRKGYGGGGVKAGCWGEWWGHVS